MLHLHPTPLVRISLRWLDRLEKCCRQLGGYFLSPIRVSLLIFRSLSAISYVRLSSDGIPPYAEVALPKLVAQQPYDISLHLVIPATEPNFALGNFMTTLKLATVSNETLITIRRPVSTLP
jgi:hypothetical protein